MRSKRFFALALVLCLVLSALAPMASAAEVESGVVTAPKNFEAATNLPFTPVDDLDIDFTKAEISDSISELKELSKQYAADEIVAAFVVMEDQPLAETHTSPLQVTAAVEKKLIDKQDDAINAIEAEVLNGEKLDVRYQFTYLTNAFSINTEFANLEKIAAMSGVKSVFVMPVYEPCADFNPNTAGAGLMTGVTDVQNDPKLGYTGAGMKIAIIDSGLDMDHPSFAAAPADPSMDAADITEVLASLNAYKVLGNVTADDLYYSEKVPFAFDYASADLNVNHDPGSSAGDHGTHVAGIAAANALEGTSVKGMAPDAQVIVMKVFSPTGGARADYIVAALEDAMTLGCDVVNASLGSYNGYSSSGYEELDSIYARLAQQDIVATFSAGNEGNNADYNMWDELLTKSGAYPMTPTRNPDNGAVGSPSTWANTLSVASADNSQVMTTAMTLADGTVVFYQNSYEYLIGDPNAIPMEDLAGQELDYVMINGSFGEDVDGKVAVIVSASGTSDQVVAAAEAAGAVAVILPWNPVNGDMFRYGYGIQADDGSYPDIPACSVLSSDVAMMGTKENKTLEISEDGLIREVAGGQMSSFSSWGVTPDMKIGPDITGIGGDVYSTLDGGNYGVMSGTSMSAPQVAGVTALVLQHLKTMYPAANDGKLRDMAEAILMSTADPIFDSYGIEASPRQQGAGLVNAYRAATTKTYLTVDGGRPKAELGDSADGVYEFSFRVHNFGAYDVTYTLGASVLTEYPYDFDFEIFMSGMDDPLTSSVSFDQDEITVPAGGIVTVNASIELNDADKAFFDAYYPNGGYVEGFVYLYNEESVLSLPYLGFYGDWSEAPIFDTAYWYDNSFWNGAPEPELPEGDQYYNIFWTVIGGKDNVLGMNPYGVLVGNDGKIMYDPAHNVVSPNGDGNLDYIDDIYLSLVRSAKYLDFTYTIDGEKIENYTFQNNAKTMYVNGVGIVPVIHSQYGYTPNDLYDFTDENGNVLPSGTTVLLTIDGYVDDGDEVIDDSIQIPITVDTEAPQILGVQAGKDGDSDLLYVFVSDDVAMAGVILMDANMNTLGKLYDVKLIPYGNGIYVAVFDVTDLGTNFVVVAGDYGCNQLGGRISYTPVPRVQFIGNSLSLAGDIGLNFYYDLPDWILADEDAYILFTDANGDEIEKIYFAEEEDPFINGDGYYRYSVQFAAKEMGEEVTAQVFSSAGEECDPVTMSIQGYVKKAFETKNANLINLMKAMLNYGAAAQVEFEYNTDNLVNNIMDEADRVLATADADAYAHKITGTDADLSIYGTSLILDSETSIRIYFNVAEGKAVEDYTFTIDGEPVTPIAKDGRYYITLTNIAAKDLDVWHTFCVGGITVEYAGLSYVARVQEVASSDADLMDLANALYAYSQAAEVFFANN